MNVKRLKVLVLEPHPDDGLYSAAGTILDYYEKGCTIISVCLFSQGDESTVRQKEHQKVYEEFFKANCIFAPFYDFIYRESGLNFNLRLFTDIRNYLRNTIKNENPDIVLGPLSIGGHPDHTLTYLAIKSIKDELSSSSVLLYEDFPYCVECESAYSEFIIKTRNTGNFKPIYKDISKWLNDKVLLYEAYHSQKEYTEVQLRELYSKHNNLLAQDGLLENPTFCAMSIYERLWLLDNICLERQMLK